MGPVMKTNIAAVSYSNQASTCGLCLIVTLANLNHFSLLTYLLTYIKNIIFCVVLNFLIANECRTQAQ